MRAALLILPLALSCAGPAPVETPDDPAALLELLGHSNSFRREEGAFRLLLLGGRIPDAIEGNERALAYAEEDLTSIRQGISQALEERQPERMVWRAYHALRGGVMARDWSAVSLALAVQGYRLSEIYEPHEQAKSVRFLAQAGAYVNPGGDRHDLFFWIQSTRKADGRWIVREVQVGLNVKFEAPFKSLSPAERYPKDSVLGKFFALPELQQTAIVFPLLEEVEFTYGRIRGRAGEGAPAGFHVNAGVAMEARAGGRGIYYTAESGLDPRETLRGRLAWDGFSSTGTVGPLTARPSGYWGSGGPRPAED